MVPLTLQMTHLLQPDCLLTFSLCRVCSEAKVVMDKAIMLDGATVSAAFDDTADMGIVGTVTGTLWYIDWLDDSSIRLVSGHMTRVPDSLKTSEDWPKGIFFFFVCFWNV